MQRRDFLALIASLAVTAPPTVSEYSTALETAAVQKRAPTAKSRTSLLSAPIELAGDWGHMLPGSVDKVVQRMRHACLAGVRLISDRQPAQLRIDAHSSGPPAVWLHRGRTKFAWVIVDIGERDWSKLAYQFGHELGHVFAN